MAKRGKKSKSKKPHKRKSTKHRGVVARLGVKRAPGYLYFLRGSDVWRTPMRRKGGRKGKASKVVSARFARDASCLYYLDSHGNVACAKRGRR